MDGLGKVTSTPNFFDRKNQAEFSIWSHFQMLHWSISMADERGLESIMKTRRSGDFSQLCL